MADQHNKLTNNELALRKEVLSVGKHSLVYVIGQGLSRAVGFFMIPVYTRFIAPTNYGAMELIEILIAAAAIIISMNVGDTMSRFYYAEKEQIERNRVVSTIVIGFGVIGIPFVLLFISISGVVSNIVLEEAQYKYYLQVAVAAVWFGMLCEICYSYLRMLYMAKIFVTLTTIQLIIALSLNIYFVVFLRLNILGIFYSTLITEGLIGITLSLIIMGKVGWGVSVSILWQLIKFGLPLVPTRIGLMLGFVANRFFLRWLVSPDPGVALAQVGLFSLGHKFGVIINRFVTVPFNSFWGPRRLELILKESEGSRETVARICTYATLLTVYLALLLSSGIESLIEIMADASYRGAHQVVPFIALSYVALGLETHFITGVLYKKKTIWSTYISILSMGVILAWNFIFVPRYGLIGAATSNLAGFAVRGTLIYIVSQHLYFIPFELGRMGIMFITAIVLYLISQMISFPSPYLAFFARTGIAALFPLVLFGMRFYTEGEVEFIGQTLRKGRKTAEVLWLQFLRPQ
jgi:O-antigen/teichoic acid export membrane protein